MWIHSTRTQFQKVILYSKIRFVLKISSIQKLIWLRFGMTNSINKHLRLKLPPSLIKDIKTLIRINWIHQTKFESRIYNKILMIKKLHGLGQLYLVILKVLDFFDYFCLMISKYYLHFSYWLKPNFKKRSLNLIWFLYTNKI